MSARDALIFLSGLNDQSTRGLAFLQRLSEYRAEVLREAADLVVQVTGNDLDANAKMLRRKAEEVSEAGGK
ncbi:hypothetical protein [Streptomyces hoynatensis]|nr:hypothetical protein [Streptomyces hoynatensis]